MMRWLHVVLGVMSENVFKYKLNNLPTNLKTKLMFENGIFEE